MKQEDQIKYWIDSAEHDLETAESLFKAAKYDWCLFIGHLILEKALKALYVKNNLNSVPPKIHNLVKLAELCNIEISEKDVSFFDRINDFNLEVRYPDYKKEFYKLCTKEFTVNVFKEIKEYFQWIKSLIK